MSHIYTPTGTGSYVGAYTMPDDGDPRNASAFNVPMEGMAEDIQRVKNTLDAGVVNMPVVRHFPFLLRPNAGNWDRIYDIFGGGFYWQQSSHTNIQIAEAPLDLPEDFEISQIQVWLNPGTGRGALPPVGERPSFLLGQQNNQTGAFASLGSATDPSATLAQYETHHAITIGWSPVHVVGRTQWSYSVIFFSEYGTSAQNGTKLYSVKVTGTAKKVF